MRLPNNWRSSSNSEELKTFSSYKNELKNPPGGCLRIGRLLPATLWLTESWPSTTAPALTPRREGLDGAVDTEWVGCCVHAFGCLCSSVCMRLSACCVPALCMLGPCACLVSANFMLWRFITLLVVLCVPGGVSVGLALTRKGLAPAVGSGVYPF